MITSTHKNRGKCIFILLISLFFAIIARLYYIQIIKGKDFSKKVCQQYLTTVTLTPKRGVIYDCNMKEMAISVKADSVFAIPKEIENKKDVSNKLAKILKLDYDKTFKKINNNKNFVWIKRQISLSEFQEISNEKISGIYFVKEDKRYYPNKTLASQILGFVNIDNRGLEGTELYCDNYLSVNPQKLIVKRDAKKRLIILPYDTKEEEKVLNGNNVKLTIDLIIQHTLERELQEVYKNYNAKGALGIIMEPATGKILALANYPNFNPNLYRFYSKDMLRNKNITDLFEPGSTFKVFVAASVLEQNIVKPEDLIYCENGKFNIGSRKLHDVHKYGWLSFREVIEKSSNIGIVKIGMSLGKNELYKFLSNFGFGVKTKIDLPGENSGILRKPKNWSKYSICAIPIGQEVSVTAIQLITAMASIANNGILMKPYIIDEIIDSSENVIKKTQPEKIKQVVSINTTNMLNEILKGVVCSGTGQNAAISGYEIVGKTGTAQKVEGGKYIKGKFVSSFIGFVPIINPKLVILVVVDEPRKQYYGSEVAAPTFRKIAQDCLNYLEILPKNEVMVKKEDKVKLVENLIKEKVIMPDLNGKTMRETIDILWKLNLEPKFIGSGIVFYQSPAPNEEVEIGNTCLVNFRKN